MTLRRIIRASALLMLGMMMLVRMGPLCESMAMAASPTSGPVAMADCDRPAPTHRSAGKVAVGACAGACLATEADRQIAAAEPGLQPALHASSLHPPLEGLSGAPVPPPPRSA
jgi:hypothetical protein